MDGFRRAFRVGRVRIKMALWPANGVEWNSNANTMPSPADGHSCRGINNRPPSRGIDNKWNSGGYYANSSGARIVIQRGPLAIMKDKLQCIVFSDLGLAGWARAAGPLSSRGSK